MWLTVLLRIHVLPKSHAVTVDFLRWSQGHRQFSSAVTRSQAVFGRSQIVTPVAALSTAHIGVTSPCKGAPYLCFHTSAPKLSTQHRWVASFPGLLTPALVLQATNAGVRKGLGTRLTDGQTPTEILIRAYSNSYCWSIVIQLGAKLHKFQSSVPFLVLAFFIRTLACTSHTRTHFLAHDCGSGGHTLRIRRSRGNPVALRNIAYYRSQLSVSARCSTHATVNNCYTSKVFC